MANVIRYFVTHASIKFELNCTIRESSNCMFLFFDTDNIDSIGVELHNFQLIID